MGGELKGRPVLCPSLSLSFLGVGTVEVRTTNRDFRKRDTFGFDSNVCISVRLLGRAGSCAGADESIPFTHGRAYPRA